MFCVHCGFKFNNDNDLFCPNCGAKRVQVAAVGNQTQENQVEVNHTQVDQSKENQIQESQRQENQVQENQRQENQVQENLRQENQVQENLRQENQRQENQIQNDQLKEDRSTSNTPETPVQGNSVKQEEVSNQPSKVPASEVNTEKVMEQASSFIIEEAPKIPEGYVYDSKSGWYYKSRGKQLANGSYVNEITWFDPKNGNTKVVDYPMTEQQVSIMLQNANMKQKQAQTGQSSPYSNNEYQQGYATGQAYQNQQNQPYQNQQNQPYQAYQNQQYHMDSSNSYATTPRKKKRTGLVLGILVTLLLLGGLAFCTWKFDWLNLGKSSKPALSEVTPTAVPSKEPIVTLTPTSTPTPVPEHPLGKLNEDYIVIAGQEFETTVTSLYLDGYGLNNEDIESLKYMKELRSLYLSNNNITNLRSLEGLSSLENLDLSNNQIYDVNALKGLTNLTSLYLNDTQISNLTPLIGMTNLSSLEITNTQVFDITPLLDIPSIMYLYLEGSPVEDYSILAYMPNLYICDVTYDETGEITPVPGEEYGDFEFTETDLLYFEPITDNYLIVDMSDYSSNQIVLFSYDELGQLVQMRFRMDIGYSLSEAEVEEYISLLAESMDIANFNYDGSVIYFDYAVLGEEFNYSKEDLILELEAGGYQIIENVN